MKLVYSSGGFAREFVRLFWDRYPSEEILFVDDNPGQGALNYKQALEAASRSRTQPEISIGLADPKLRRQKCNQAVDDGFTFFSIYADTPIVGDNCTVSDGAIFSDFTIVTADAKIGKGSVVSAGALVTKDVEPGTTVIGSPAKPLASR